MDTKDTKKRITDLTASSFAPFVPFVFKINRPNTINPTVYEKIPWRSIDHP